MMNFDHPHLSRLPQGYVAWRGRSVEHFDFRGDQEGFARAGRELAQHCEMLEAKGFPVTARTCMFRPLFREAPAGTPWLQAMTTYYTVLADSTGRARRCIFGLPDHAAVAVGVDDGLLALEYGYESDAAFGTTNLLDQLQNDGFRSCDASNCSYDRLTQLFVEAGLTPELVAAVLAATVPEQADKPHAECPA
ncbi:hypothetical protein [Massilia orientalis]|uniref:Uncharacterized protein n=1 Tax=Massilia orientalis TaxID=3050128 RepID=A0ACC7MDH0_9BURK|nr:hypothetical protein [Massilia sp. YIM B02787]